MMWSSWKICKGICKGICKRIRKGICGKGEDDFCEKSYGEYETYSGSGTKCFGNSRGWKKNHNKSITKPKLGYLSRDILKNF